MLESFFTIINVNFTYICIAFITCLALYMKNVYSYWSSRNVKNPTPIWFIGNILDRLFSKLSIAESDQKLYKEYYGSKYFGFYELTKPVFMATDPDLIKIIMIKDFEYFTDRSAMNFNNPVMDQTLLRLEGPVWKKVRSVMTPTFSSGKIKLTLSLVKECSENLVKCLKMNLSKNVSLLEINELYGMFTMDTIASIAFGVNSDSLSNKSNEFSRFAAKVCSPLSKWRKPFLLFQLGLPPYISKFLRLNFFNLHAPIDFFSKVVSDTIKYRRENRIRRSDFLQLLIDASIQEHQLSNGKSDHVEKGEKVLTETIITAQSVLFYIAGLDTTATTLSFVSYCLALNPDVQSRLVDEIDNLLENTTLEDLTFEDIQNLVYLDMVFSESLRLFPPAPHVDRRCTKTYKIPDTELVIEKGVKMVIPIYSIHHDARFYENPEKFDPERFTAENKASRHPMVYLPFGAGPRNCIGMRFALMEAKLAMVHLLKEFTFLRCEKTQVPIVLEKKSRQLLKAENGVWVKVASRH